ncbi:MAG: prepilin-type N-terminal cleavage/methylation domain-containing protein [Planctomycetia bacterium]|nr:prepilin-type N-terminal cleavage/methylation domain-containing protein [Planctomycetia bacterium]
MLSRSFVRSARRGFTLIELLVAMALIVFIMVILSEAFAAGLEAFRNLKAIGDQQEKLRTAAQTLRRDLQSAHFDSMRRVMDGLRTGVVDPEDAADLRRRYEAIIADAKELDAQFEELEQKVNPAAKRVIRRIRETLRLIKELAENMVEVLRLIEVDSPN